MLIERLKGTVCLTLANGVIVDVNGVGYRVELPLSMVCDIPESGSDIELWTYTYVREDALKLFGFRTYGERLAFELLLGLSGVGPKLALAILSTLSLETIRSAVISERQEVFKVVPGIGSRLAEKILVDLKSKIGRLASVMEGAPFHGGTAENSVDSVKADEVLRESYLLDDVRSALENLGFKEKAITPVLKRLVGESQGLSFQDIMRKALVGLGAMPQKEPSGVAGKSVVQDPKLDTIDSQLF